MTLSREQAQSARNQLLEEGFCVVDNVLDDEFLVELQDWSDTFCTQQNSRRNGNTKVPTSISAEFAIVRNAVPNYQPMRLLIA